MAYDFIPEGQEHLFPSSQRGVFRDFIPDEVPEPVKPVEPEDVKMTFTEKVLSLPDVKAVIDGENKEMFGEDAVLEGVRKCSFCGTEGTKNGKFASDFALKAHIRFCAAAKAAIAAKAANLSAVSPLENWDGNPETLPAGFVVKE